MDARTLARLLGGDVLAGLRVIAPGPGHSVHDRSMSILVDTNAPDGFLVNSFAGDDWRDCREHVLRLMGLDGTRRETSLSRSMTGTTRTAPASDAAPDRVRLARRLWAAALPLCGSPAETYLRMRVPGIDRSGCDTSVLRFHPACPFRLADGTLARLPAMLAAMTDIRTNTFCGVHRTALRADGSGKSDHAGLGSPKRMLGIAAGACVRLCSDEEVTHGLHLAEGIETALACMAMGFQPTWAALSAGAIERFPVLAGIEALTVFADNDPNGAGLAAARSCALRWRKSGAEVRIFMAPMPGTDFTDFSGAV